MTFNRPSISPRANDILQRVRTMTGQVWLGRSASGRSTVIVSPPVGKARRVGVLTELDVASLVAANWISVEGERRVPNAVAVAGACRGRKVTLLERVDAAMVAA